jgi:hypothetical protein
VRRAGRTDGNQARVVAKLRELGCLVWITSAVGHGAPDLVIRTPRGTVLLVEVKDGTAPLRQRQLTPDELLFSADWGASYVVVSSDADARRVAAC